MLGGRDVYLGRCDSEVIRAEYDRIIAGGCGRPARPGDDLTVAELMLEYFRFAEGFYRDPEGGPSHELRNIKDAFPPLKNLNGPTEAAKFGPSPGA
jgi:hypothetical protein